MTHATARIDDLLERMTLDEKLAQLGCVWCTSLVDADGFASDRARRRIPHGIGEVTRIGASTGLRPRERAALANEIQRFCVDETRLGIPTIVHEESTAGLCARDATQFPQAIGLASTWDPELMEEIGAVIRRQMVATGARHTLAPVLDIARDPRWGRTEETYGESPYLASRLGVAYVRGVQGEAHTAGAVAATGKHFLGYGFSEGGMNHAPTHLGPRELREVAAEPFRAAIAEADLATVMNAYTSVDGLACGASRAILDDLLRGELGFTGAVVADYFTTGLLISHHRVADSPAMAAQRAIEAGLDMELPALQCYGSPLKGLVEAGTVEIALVDRSVRRVLELKERLGLFDEPFVDEDAAADSYGRADDRALARRAGHESLVLLTNDGVLPIDPGPLATIAVIGPAADDVRLLQGDYSYPAHTEMLYQQDGSAGDNGILPQSGSAFGAGPYFPPSVTPLAGLRAAVGATTEVRHARGCEIVDGDRSGIADAAELARASDVAIVCVGGRSGLLARDTSGEFRDASDLRLPGVQHELVDAVLGTGTPTAVVVVSGRAHSLGSLAERANAVLYAWLPGEEGGAAIADVLLGSVAPSGRLPISLPRTVGQVPLHHDHRAGGGRSEMLGDYIDAPTTPQWPFGHGLTYSRVEYEAIATGDTTTSEPITVSCTVTNTGAREVTEVVQCYLRDDVARVARPDRMLAGFARVRLAPGARRTVEFGIDPSALAYYNEAMQLVVEPGSTTVMLGASASDIRLEAAIEVGGPERVIAPNDRRPARVSLS